MFNKSILLTLCYTATAMSVCAQTVNIRNVSAPHTNLEVGNYAEIWITGAAPLKTVTVVQNGGGPYTMGTTDASGYWTVTAQQISAWIGSYNQTWYVDGVPVTPATPSTLPFGPSLPNYTVYANFVGSKIAAHSTSAALTCPGTSTSAGQYWHWSPIVYTNYSSYGSPVSDGFTAWNSVQSRLPFSTDNSVRDDMAVYTATLGPTTAGVTVIYGETCFACLGFIDQCTGGTQCYQFSWAAYAEVGLDSSTIATQASLLGVAANTLAKTTTTHELGHVLRLGDITPVNGICSEVQSIMYGSLSMLTGCGVVSPTSSDVSVITGTIYPSNVPVCPTYTYPWCDFAYPC